MRAVTLQDYKRRILQVLAYIGDHLDDPLPLDELAALACFSPYHFHRIFKGMVGESVKEYVRRLRLERAASQLKVGSASVIEIALDAGYESHEAFTRSFKRCFGAAPSHFRLIRRAQFANVSSGVHYRPGETIQHFRTLHRGGDMDVKIQQLKPRRVAFLRHVGPYGEVSSTWDRLLTIMGKDGYLGGGTMMLGICHDDPEVTPSAKIRYDACVTVGDDFVPGGDIQVQTVAGGEYAMTTHAGPYNNLGRTYAELLGQWVPRSGRELRDVPCFEVYLNDPQSTAPEDLLTDIYAPLQAQQRNEVMRP
jgi:AraC family transcriptional regulator